MKSLQIRTRQMITRRVMLYCHNLRKALYKRSKKMGLMKKSKIKKTRPKYQIQTNQLREKKKKFLSQTQNLMKMSLNQQLIKTKIWNKTKKLNQKKMRNQLLHLEVPQIKIQINLKRSLMKIKID